MDSLVADLFVREQIEAVSRLCRDRVHAVPELKKCFLFAGHPMDIFVLSISYSMSDMTKGQMIVHLAFKSKILLWGGIACGSLSIGYAVMRNWNRWKEWRQNRQLQQQRQAAISDADTQIAAEEETGDVPDGELCVICLMRRRRSAFIPCGHLVCCQLCAISVERESTPKCPVCRQEIRNSVRIYDS
ncbi:E3 ubiquitin-protein ligase SPL2 [Fagus crenata]